MTPNEKRLRSALAHHVQIHLYDNEIAGLVALLDAAERRGEDRVLRRFVRYGYDIEVDEYRRDRRARGGMKR